MPSRTWYTYIFPEVLLETCITRSSLQWALWTWMVKSQKSDISMQPYLLGLVPNLQQYCWLEKDFQYVYCTCTSCFSNKQVWLIDSFVTRLYQALWQMNITTRTRNIVFRDFLLGSFSHVSERIFNPSWLSSNELCNNLKSLELLLPFRNWNSTMH